MGICVRKVKKRKYAKETNTIAAETPIRAKLCRSTAGLVLEYPTIYKYNKIYNFSKNFRCKRLQAKYDGIYCVLSIEVNGCSILLERCRH